MERRFVVIVAAAAVFMPVLLLLDRSGGVNQIGLGVATAAFLWLVVRHSSVNPRQVIWCIVIASAGEVVLSLGWGLYHYQHAIIPLYVPPGHGLFYTLAVITAQQDVCRRYAERITTSTMVIGSIVAIVGLLYLQDTWGFIWWVGALVLIRYSNNALLLSSCFAYTILLEWAGTAIGNWTWAASVPFLGLHSANPPSGVGILYIILDLLVVGVSSALGVRPPRVGAISAVSERTVSEAVT